MNRFFAAIAGVACAVTTSNAMFVSSTFDVDAEGWTGEVRDSTYRDVAGTVSSSEIYPDGEGLIRLTDPDNGFTVFRASAAYEGDLSWAFGGSLSFDYETDNLTFPSGWLVVLIAGDDSAISSFFDIPQADVQFRAELVFEEGTDWLASSDGTGAAATEAEIQNVLADVAELLISAETGTTSFRETVEIDNVLLVPAPGAAGLLGVVGMVAARRRRG